MKSNYSGLFEYIRDATIKNLGLVNVDINVESKFGSVGALASYCNGFYSRGEKPKGSYIENCYVTGKVEGTYNAAGLIGKSSYTEYKNCLNFASISRCDSGSGIVGSTSTSKSNYGYYNCINFGKIGGDETADIAHGSKKMTKSQLKKKETYKG